MFGARVPRRQGSTLADMTVGEYLRDNCGFNPQQVLQITVVSWDLYTHIYTRYLHERKICNIYKDVIFLILKKYIYGISSEELTYVNKQREYVGFFDRQVIEERIDIRIVSRLFNNLCPWNTIFSKSVDIRYRQLPFHLSVVSSIYLKSNK